MTGDVRFDGEVAIVTGAGGGLGRQYALDLAGRGALVVVNDIAVDESTASDTVAEIVGLGGQAVAHTGDVTDPAAADELVALALEAGGRLDVLVNNAGIPPSSLFGDTAAADFDRVVDVSLGAAIRLARAAWPALAARAGRIVNTTSCSIFGIASSAPYIVAKAGAWGLTKALAYDGRDAGIKVNAVMPMAYTRMTAMLDDEAMLDFVKQALPTAKAAPLVTALAHRDVPWSGEVFHSGGGLVAPAAWGFGPGLVDHEPTPEKILARSGELAPTSGVTPFHDLNDVIAHIFQQVS
jgi:hypothetical protein